MNTTIFSFIMHILVLYKMRRTIKIKLDSPKENLLELLKTCSQVFNKHVDWSFSSNSYNKNKAHKDLYSSIREEFKSIPSGLIQSIRDMALESIKSTSFKFKPFKSETSGVRFDTRCASVRGNLLSISTLGKREKLLLSIPKHFQEIFDSWKFTGMQLTYDKHKKIFYANLNYEKENPKTIVGELLGIDRGLKNIVSCSNGFEVSGKTRNRVKRQRAFQRKCLQAKGTRSAKWRKRQLSGREKRFSLNENHIISKQLVNLPYSVFILEKLSKMNVKKHGKRFNRKISNWSYYQLEQLLRYKAEAIGKRVEYVDARYTSQRCNCCGHIERSNRKGDNFKCKNCGHEDGADLNASKNIRDLWSEAETNPIPRGQGRVNGPRCLPAYRPGLISQQARPVGS